MVKLTRIYTRTGDSGTTGLADGGRAEKHGARITAIGEVDEANSALGIAAQHLGAEAGRMVARIQNELFDLGADLATPGADGGLRILPEQAARLEAEIDRMNADLAPLNSFILPGGNESAAHLHLARAIVRRAERAAFALAAESPVNPAALAYINRLSDHLFVLARWLNRDTGGDVLWVPGATRA